MKRYTSCLVFAAWLCTSASADDDNSYTPPQPLHEAVTARTAATDINDTSLAGAQEEKSPVEVADSLRQGASRPSETSDDTTLTKSGTDASSSSSTDEAKMSEITGTSAAPADSVNETASSVAPAVPQIDEIAEKAMAPAMVQTKQSRFPDPITEMMGGEFNTEANQKMAESFLSFRPRINRLKANRDF